MMSDKTIRLLGADEDGAIKFVNVPINTLYVPTDRSMYLTLIKSMLSQSGMKWDLSPGSHISMLISIWVEMLMVTERKVSDMLEQLASATSATIKGPLPTEKIEITRESQKPW